MVLIYLFFVILTFMFILFFCRVNNYTFYQSCGNGNAFEKLLQYAFTIAWIWWGIFESSVECKFSWKIIFWWCLSHQPSFRSMQMWKKMFCVNLRFRHRGLLCSLLKTADFTGSNYCCITTAEAYLEPSRTSTMERFCENSQPVFVKKKSQESFIVDVLLGSKCVSECARQTWPQHQQKCRNKLA